MFGDRKGRFVLKILNLKHSWASIYPKSYLIVYPYANITQFTINRTLINKFLIEFFHHVILNRFIMNFPLPGISKSNQSIIHKDFLRNSIIHLCIIRFEFIKFSIMFLVCDFIHKNMEFGG